MINYNVTLRKKDGKLKKVKVCAETIERAEKISLYWEDIDTKIEKIEKKLIW